MTFETILKPVKPKYELGDHIDVNLKAKVQGISYENGEIVYSLDLEILGADYTLDVAEPLLYSVPEKRLSNRG